MYVPFPLLVVAPTTRLAIPITGDSTNCTAVSVSLFLGFPSLSGSVTEPVVEVSDTTDPPAEVPVP